MLQDDNGKTAYDVACRHNKYESARLLRALHWAHKKDVAQNKKLWEEQLSQSTKTKWKVVQAHIQAERAESAYNQWLEEKRFKKVKELSPQECEKRKQSMSQRRERPSCASCAFSGECEDHHYTFPGPLHVAPIKVSHHQETRNLDSVGKPDKMHPYTNYHSKPKDSGATLDSRDRSASAMATFHPHFRSNSRATHHGSASVQSGVQFYTRRLKSGHKKRESKASGAVKSARDSGRTEAVVSTQPDSTDYLTIDDDLNELLTIGSGLNDFHGLMAEQRATTSEAGPGPSAIVFPPPQFSESDHSDSEPDELDFSKLMADQHDQLAYPKFDFVEDDDSFFHDVGECNSLDSLSLPATLTKDKTPAEVLQLLRHLAQSDGNKRLKRSKSLSYSGKQFHGQLRRRFSLGCIPEGRIVTDYAEEEDEDNIDSQLLRDLEKSVDTIAGVEREGTDGKRDEDNSSPPPAAQSPAHEEKPADSLSPKGELHKSASSELLPGSESGDRPTPPQVLKVVNLAWDVASGTVQSQRMSLSTTPTHPQAPSLAQERKSFSHFPRDSRAVTTPLRDMTTPSSLASLEDILSSHKVMPSTRKPSRSSLSTSRATTPAPPAHKTTPPSRKTTTPPSRKVTPPSRKTTPPSHKTATPFRKVTPPSRKITPPPPLDRSSIAITPPPDEITPKLEAADQASLLRLPTSGTPSPTPSTEQLIRTPSPTFHHSSASDPCMYHTGYPTSPSPLSPASSTKTMPCPSTALFYIGDAGPPRTAPTTTEVSISYVCRISCLKLACDLLF